MWRGTGWKRGFCGEEDFVGKKILSGRKYVKIM
jgi:hypothetical protein